MLIYYDFRPESLYVITHELVRMAYPGCQLQSGTAPGRQPQIRIELEARGESVLIMGSVADERGATNLNREHRFTIADEEQELGWRLFIKSYTYNLLCLHLGKNINSYGILTGVRPVKLVHKLMDRAFNKEQIAETLNHKFQATIDKTRLLIEVAENNRKHLLTPALDRKLVSIYIGIPFCPSICHYCSFPGALLSNYDMQIKTFLYALNLELNGIADCFQQLSISVRSIYIGGGTPTVLSEKDLEFMLELLNDRFISENTAEITVEAGRPDTINLQKLKLLKEFGVNRVCVNPQTMNNDTLRFIGRNHNMEGVLRSIEMVRNAGIKKINMDLIVGLPGENLQENTYTANEILKIRPDNVTVHTLSLKKGSKMAVAEPGENINDRVSQVQQGVEFFSETLRMAGYQPYYLYRQKYMKANMENIGYTLPGSECLYNIQMMEERQTIIGMGGGAASKFINLSNNRLTSFYNPKNPVSYCESIKKLIKGKVDKLWALN